MFTLPAELKLLERMAPAFTRPTYPRFLLLCLGAIVCFGRRSVSRILWLMQPHLQGHPSDYHRVLSRAPWSLWPLGRILAEAVVALIPATERVVVGLDDTVDGPHDGDRVYGRGCWRDAVRSSQKHLSLKWGQKWVVLAVNVRFCFARRTWALPILVALARKEELDKQEKHRHKTPAELGKQLLAVLLHWFPQRQFLVLGDWGFGAHELAEFCHDHHPQMILIARCRADTNLYSLPRVPRRTKGGWQKKAHKLPAPHETVARAQGYRRTLAWYGNTRRELKLVSGCGGWYSKHRNTVVPIRWVYSYDQQEKREDYLYSTDLTLKPEQVVEAYAGRFAIEVTFEEVRAHLGLQSTRCRTPRSILRTAPCLLGLFTLVSLSYAQIAKHRKPRPRQMPCYAKADPTFSDALFAVRRLLWEQVLLRHRACGVDVTELPQRFRNTILSYLAEAG